MLDEFDMLNRLWEQDIGGSNPLAPTSVLGKNVNRVAEHDSDVSANATSHNLVKSKVERP